MNVCNIATCILYFHSNHILMKKQNTMVVLWSENGPLLEMQAFGLFNWIQLDYNWTEKTADLLCQ